MRLFTKLCVTGLLLASGLASAQEAGGRIVLVLPFDNRSGNTSLSWIGDSFPDTLNKRLTSAGFLTLSHDDRNFAYSHLGLPEDFKPSRATAIRIAQQLDANYVIVGSYTVQSDASSQATNGNISIQAQVLSVDDLKLSAPIQEAQPLNHLFDAENSTAWKVARALDPHFSVALQTFLAAGGAVPLPAFEDYIRGSNAATDAERLQRLKSAVQIAPGYAAALLALGKQQYTDRDYKASAATLAKVPTTDRLALEANFYLGLARFNDANYAGAEQAFAFVASKLPLPEVVNDQAVAITRQGKDAADIFQRAIFTDPNDEDFHYNLALALFRRGDTTGASNAVAAALKLKPTDAEAQALQSHLAAVPAGTKLSASSVPNFTPLERIRRNYSESGYRQLVFQLDQVRLARMATLSTAQQAAEYTQSGNNYLAQGQLPEAEKELQSALAADSGYAPAHASLAEVRERSGNAASARDEAQASLRIKPSVAAWLVLGRLDLAASNVLAASSDVNEALNLEPNNAQAIALRLSIQQKAATLH